MVPTKAEERNAKNSVGKFRLTRKGTKSGSSQELLHKPTLPELSGPSENRRQVFIWVWLRMTQKSAPSSFSCSTQPLDPPSSLPTPPMPHRPAGPHPDTTAATSQMTPSPPLSVPSPGKL